MSIKSSTFGGVYLSGEDAEQFDIGIEL